MQTCVPASRRMADMIAPVVITAALCFSPVHADAHGRVSRERMSVPRHHIQRHPASRAAQATAFGEISDIVLRGEPGAPVACALAGDFEPYHRHGDALPARLFAPAQHAVYFRRGRGGTCTAPGVHLRG